MLDLTQRVLGMLAGAVGIIYLTGGVIVNLHLSRFGVSEYQVLKAKYLAVGLNFLINLALFVFAVSIVCMFLLPVVSLSDLHIRLVVSTIALSWLALLYYSQRFRLQLKRFWSRIFKCVEQKAAFHLWILSVIGISLYPVSITFSYEWVIGNIQQVNLYTGIAALHGIAGLALLALYFGVELYANPVPVGPQSADFIGTGKMQKVKFAGKADDLKLLQRLGITLESPQLTSEVGLLDETDDYYLVVVVGDEGEEKAIKISRDLVKGLAYTREKKAG